MARFLIFTLLLLFPITHLAHAQDKRYFSPATDSLMSHELIDAQTKYIAGIREFELENYEKALELLSEAYIKLPNHAGVNFAIADTYYALEDLSNAAYYAKQAVRLEPENPWYHLKLSKIYEENGENELAINEIKRVIELQPNDMDLLVKLAQTYAGFGKLKKSNAVYKKVLQKEGSSVLIHSRRFNNFNSLGMIDSALVELEAIKEIDPANIKNYHRLSQLYLKNNQPQKAIDVLEEAVNRNDRDPQTLLLLSDIYIEQSNWKEAGHLLDTIVQDSLIEARNKLNIVEYLVESYRNNQQDSTLKRITGNAVEHFTQINEGYDKAFITAANYYQITGETEKALKALEKTNEVNPSNDRAWRQRIQLLFEKQLYSDVIKVGKQADKHVPQDPFILYFTGASYFLQNSYEKAAEWLTKASQVPARRPFKSSVYAMLGDTYASLEKWDESDNAYQQALRANPDNHNAMNNYAYYLSLRSKNLDQARHMILQALEIGGRNASYLDTAGWIFFKLKDYEKAEQYIREALDTGSASAEVMEHMGDVYEKLNNLEKAKNWWEKALEADPSRTHLKSKLGQES